MPDTLYSLEDHFDALAHACQWHTFRLVARRASALFALLGDALLEGRKLRTPIHRLYE
jgi:hypothetical protein